MPIRGGRLGPQAMAKEELKGIITAFKGGLQVQDTYVTILEVEREGNRKALIGRKVLWQREDGLRIAGRVVHAHGNGRAVLVRWKRGFPPQGIGTSATIVPK